MIAVLSVPGSALHDWKYFRDRGEAERWLDDALHDCLTDNPVVGTVPARVLSDRESQRVRWQDGRRVYWHRPYAGFPLEVIGEDFT